ncbi:insulin receptor substrate 2-B [Neoarius graeffei]|uniref:insulin receptor substrate 2-B n=1 Tax=Neoarius graeffei TaxID=443677 RepID=UPI00298D15CC|nr:insulin receptor substrate 2-B [Neoarius graeffei]
MANLANYPEGSAAMLMLEAQQRSVGASPASNGGPTSGDPPSSPLNSGGVSSTRLHHHHHQQQQQRATPPNTHPPQDHQQHFDHENYQQSPVRKSLLSNLKPGVHEDSAATSHTQATSSATTAMAVNTGAAAPDGLDDIRKCGYLRKQKHGHKRFFVLRSASRSGPSRLEYYDSEKKFRSSLRSAAAAAASSSSSSSSTGTAAASASPKRVIYLYQCFTVNKRADSKNKHLIALYTKDEYFAIVAENEQEQEDWYLALSDLMNEGKKSHTEADELDDAYGTVTPGTVFKEVWQVNVKPKGLGQTKNLTGVYRLCLSSKTIHLVKLNSETPCVNLQLMNIRRCGHSESFFFIEVGRSSSIGPGEIWMQVDDSVVAQSMHETILDTMKALKAYAEFRPRSKSQSSGSNPMAFMTTRRHLGNLPPSQTGLQRRSRAESVVGTPPSSKSSGASGYRFRTSSEGEGTMNRPFRSVTGSLIHLNTARANLGRQESSGGTGSRYVRAPPGATYHARSASLPVSHFPSTTSPVSMSSSSGHGSVTDTNTRPSSASICGSPSDGGFNSSDEYGSSPGDFRYFRVRSNTPDSLSNTPPIREEHCLSDYMAMSWSRDTFSGSAGEASRDETADEDSRSFRRRTPSFSRQVGAGSAGGVAVYQKMTQTNFALDEAVSEGSFLGSNGQLASISSSLRSDYSSSSEHSQDHLPALRAADSFKDDGYMPMMAGVVPSTRDTDYMPMQPSPLVCASPQQTQSMASPPSQHMDSQGYMMMLPGGNGGADPPAPPSPHISSRDLTQRGNERPENGEYMDMSQSRPVASRRKFSNDSYYTLTAPEIPKSYSSYFSLPRSYKTPAKHRREHDEYVPMSSPAKPVYISPSTTPEHNGCSDCHSACPNRLSLSQRGFHGSLQASDLVECPSSPGEYINIEFGDQASYSLATEDTLTSQSTHRQDRHSPLPQDYMSVEVDGLPPKSQSSRSSLVAPWNPPTYIRTSGGGVTLGQPDDYTEMSCGPCEERNSPTTMLQHLSICEQRYPSSSTPVEPKVIRADPQGRRRHSSETFITSTEVTGANGLDNSASGPSTVSQVEDKKWQSSSSFDSTWMCVENKAAGDAEEALGLSSDRAEASASSMRTRRTLSVEHQNGLNYIALDLREDEGTESASAEPQMPTSGMLIPENGEYASIDFTKSERIPSKE